ncbi:DUF3667 domain-containing protein [Qipengyuania sp. DGS5-3]|uniref:DUF3667 domain-containing protein n=1 Tax=Qipengyuania sp. DGS5-3 TaxID=3349632 RepID=UPI0036D23992
MSDFGDAIGTATTGGLVAGAVDGPGSGKKEPRKKGERSPVASNIKMTELVKGHFAEKLCLNCGTELIGSHCHSCGQKAHLHRTIGAFLHDILHGALHFDGKTWRTLPKLIFKPGKLTRRYIDGERARFVSPIALFLFSVFLMFAVFQAIGLTTPTNIAAPQNLGVGLEQAQEELEADLAEVQAELDGLPEDDPRREEVQARLTGVTEGAKAISSINQNLPSDGTTTIDLSGAEFSGTGIDFIDKNIIKKWKENPGLMLYKLQANSYKFSWMLIPISIPFVWLMFFWRRRFRAYDHAIFVTYSLAFMSLLFVTLSVAATLGAPTPLIALSAIFIPPLHMYKQLKYGYELSRAGALLRTFLLTNIVVFVVLAIFLWLLIALGAF